MISGNQSSNPYLAGSMLIYWRATVPMSLSVCIISSYPGIDVGWSFFSDIPKRSEPQFVPRVLFDQIPVVWLVLHANRHWGFEINWCPNIIPNGSVFGLWLFDIFTKDEPVGSAGFAKVYEDGIGSWQEYKSITVIYSSGQQAWEMW